MWHVAEHRDSVRLLSGREGSAVKGEFCNGPAVGQTLDIFPSGQSGEREREEGKDGGEERWEGKRGMEGKGRWIGERERDGRSGRGMEGVGEGWEERGRGRVSGEREIE